MSAKLKFPRAKAYAVADQLQALLTPFCDKIEIAGSLRRGASFVGDIEILYVPRVEEVKTGLFADDFRLVNQVDGILIGLLASGTLAKRPNINGSTCWGASNKYARHIESDIPVDFFATTAPNWWVSLVIRTGGKKTNLALTMGANKRGLSLRAYGSGFTRLGKGGDIPCRSEREVFEIAGLPYIEPENRA